MPLNRFEERSQPPGFFERQMRELKGLKEGVQVLKRHRDRVEEVMDLAGKQGEIPDFSDVPRIGAKEMSEVVQSTYGIDIQVHGDIPKLGNDQRGIVMSNHPSVAVLWPYFDVVTKHFSPNLMSTVKASMLTNPIMLPNLLCKPSQDADMIIPLSRNNTEDDISAIENGCESLLTPGKALNSFIDSSRPTASKIRKAQVDFEKKYADPTAKEWLKYTGFPKSGGIGEVLFGTEKYDVKIANFTVASDKAHDDPAFFGSTVHVYGEEVSRDDLWGPSEDRSDQIKHIRKWLGEDIKRKNEMIRVWRKDSA